MKPLTISREVDADMTRRLGYKIVDLIADELADPCRRPALPTGVDFEELDELLGGESGIRTRGRL